jgi:poly(A) polymerase
MLPVAKHIVPPFWMVDYRSVKIMRALGAYEAEPQALFVGGCVRNSLLGRPVSDIDIATVHQPLAVIEKLKAAGIRYVPTGLDHGTVTAIVEDVCFEVTSLRRDIDTDGRYAVIAFTTKWEEDAQRRDFTINTLLAGMDGAVYDPTAAGLEDIEKRRVAFVGEPAQRIAEDYLRILRFFRFYAQYGEGAPDKAALDACAEKAGKISSLSRQRVTQEFLKTLAVANPAPVLRLMFSKGILSDVGKEFKEVEMERLCDLQARYDARDIMARMFTVAGMKANCFEERFTLSNAQKRQIEVFAQGAEIAKSVSKKRMRELVYRVGNAAALQVYFLYLSKNDRLPDIELIEIARYWQPPTFPVKAEDLIRAGVMQGPALGRTLKEQEGKWIAKDFPANFRYKK